MMRGAAYVGLSSPFLALAAYLYSTGHLKLGTLVYAGAFGLVLVEVILSRLEGKAPTQ